MVHIENGRDHFWQWDLDQRLIVDNPTVEEVHFCNAMSESALVCEVREENGVRYVNLPNILLQSALCISAYSHCDGYTVVNQRFNVIERTRPDDYVYTETQVMRWQDLEQRVKDGVGYYVPNVDADGNLSWTSDNPLLPSVETVNVKGTKGDPGEVTESQLAAAIAPLNVADSIQAKRISNLEAAAKGVLYREETDTTEAYAKAVPTGAQKWASLDKVGGKTVVNAGELVSAEVVEVESRGKNLFDLVGFAVDKGAHVTQSGDTISVTPTSAMYSETFVFSDVDIPVTISAKSISIVRGTNPRVQILRKDGSVAGEIKASTLVNTMSGSAVRLNWSTAGTFEYECLQIERGSKATEYSPYGVKGTFPIPAKVREMCPGYGWSAGTVCNEIDFERKVYVQRVGSVDLGTLEWLYDSAKKIFFSAPVLGIYKHNDNSAVPKWLCANYVTSSFNAIRDDGSIKQNMAMGQGFERALGANCQCIRDDSYTDSAAFKSAMQGVMLYYELAEPIEVDLSGVLSDGNFIEVEAGGTITFKQASTQLPVPSSVTYQISTKEAIANA